MKVFFVGAGPGAPELLTVKAARLLRETKCCIYAGSLVNPAILELLPDDATRHDSARMTLDEILMVIKGAREEEIDVVRLHTGEPSIYGAIGEQMDALDELGIDYEVVPGISAFQGAAAALRVELTAPKVSQTVILTRIAGRTPVPASQQLDRLAPSLATLCMFLSVGKIEEVAHELTSHYGTDCPAAVVFRATWPDEKVVRGELGQIAALVRDEKITGTAMILVGHALKRPLAHASLLYNEHFTHGYRQGDHT
ncbi:MAG: precorrin-4 C(11)-methyltransferase [Planctomycetota bacterium]|jgi:precorrin-4/cobalt-precorrin-4 C11-methyltransferase